MLLQTDIHPDWSAPDVALFVGLIANIQAVIRGTVDAHQRQIGCDTVQDLIAKAALVAIKSEAMQQGLRTRDLGLAFIEHEARLRAEIVDMSKSKQALIASLDVAGRA